MTLDCVTPTELSVIQTIHCNVGLKCLFSILPKCFLLSLFVHFSFIFHKVVQRRIYGVVRSIITTLSQIVCRVCQRKKFENRPIIGKDMDKSIVARLFGPPCIIGLQFLAVAYTSQNEAAGARLKRIYSLS